MWKRLVVLTLATGCAAHPYHLAGALGRTMVKSAVPLLRAATTAAWDCVAHCDFGDVEVVPTRGYVVDEARPSASQDAISTASVTVHASSSTLVCRTDWSKLEPTCRTNP